MSENALAQEEIDALLQAANLSDEDDGGGEEKSDLADGIADEFLNSANDIFMSLIGNDVSVEKNESGPIPVDMLAQEVTEPVALAFVESGKGLNTTALLVFDEKKMTVATDMVLMGEGEAKDKFSEDDIDALKEAVNQIMGNLGQNLTSKYSESISFEQADISVAEPEGALATIKEKIADENLHNAFFTLKIADKVETQFRLLLPLSIEERLGKLQAKLDVASAKAPAVGGDVAEEPATEEGTSDEQNLDMILDLNVEIVVKLGETVRSLSEITDLIEGNILALDKASNAPVDVIVNNKIIAKGELIIIPPYNFAIKVSEVKDKLDRIKNLSFH